MSAGPATTAPDPGMEALGHLVAVPCDACGRADAKPVVTRPDGLTVVECACGMAYLSPRPADVTAFYRAGYYTGRQAGIGYADRAVPTRAQRLRTDREVRARLEVVTSSVDLAGRTLLEVGCGTGDLAELARRSGAAVTAVDVSEEAVAIARARHPALEVVVADYEAIEGRYDVVCAFEVIEHVPSPRAFLAAMRRLVAPGGWLFLSTPDYARAAELAPQPWLGFMTSLEHLTYLSHDVLIGLVVQAGFTIESWHGMGGGEVAPPSSPGPIRRLVASIPGARSLKAWLEPTPRYARAQTGHDLLLVARG